MKFFEAYFPPLCEPEQGYNNSGGGGLYPDALGPSHANPGTWQPAIWKL